MFARSARWRVVQCTRPKSSMISMQGQRPPLPLDSSHELSEEEYTASFKYDPDELPLPLDASRELSEEEYSASLVHGRSVRHPLFHPKTHNIPVANIHFRSHHVPLLNLFTHFAAHAASSLGIPTSNIVMLPTQRSLWTVLRSPFIYKKSQENFERKVHKRLIKAWDADPEVIRYWVVYLRTHAMAGVGMKVTTWDRMPLILGSSDEEIVHNVDPAFDTPQTIMAMSEKILAQSSKIG